MQGYVVRQVQAETQNAFYLANREPLAAMPLSRLPLGSVRPQGWLKHQLDLMVDGMTGHLPEWSLWLTPDNPWLVADGPARKPSFALQPYWLRGVYDLAVMTGNEKLLQEATFWIERIIENQQDDGYFGPQDIKAIELKGRGSIADLWPQMNMMDTLVSHYEHTGDPRIIALLTSFFTFCRNLPDDQFIPKVDFVQWYTWRRLYEAYEGRVQVKLAGMMLPHIYWLYNHTGDTWLLDLASRTYQHLMPPEGEWLEGHVVNFTGRYATSGIYYQQSKEAWHLDAVEYWYGQHLGTWGQQPRGIFAADENIRPFHTDPRQGIELCGIIEFAKSFHILGRITGDPRYADRCEDIMLNHFPAAQTPDLKAIHYLTASNQPQLDASPEHECSNKGTPMFKYSPYEVYHCCQHNVAGGWPWHVKNLWQASADNGLIAWMYGASQVAAKVGEAGRETAINSVTDYPFEERATMTIASAEPIHFPLYLRVPQWCNRFRVAVNGEPVEVHPEPRTYVRLERLWAKGDTVTVEMPMDVSLTRWPRNGSVTVDRGPLSYSLKIGEEWRHCGGTEAWPEWEVLPATPWNYGLVLDRDHPAESLEVVKRGTVGEQPWKVEAAPIEIKTRGKRIPAWDLENNTVQELGPSPVKSDQPEEEIALVPLGCARLRMSCLPVIGEGSGAWEWPSGGAPEWKRRLKMRFHHLLVYLGYRKADYDYQDHL